MDSRLISLIISLLLPRAVDEAIKKDHRAFANSHMRKDTYLRTLILGNLLVASFCKTPETGKVQSRGLMQRTSRQGTLEETMRLE